MLIPVAVFAYFLPSALSLQNTATTIETLADVPLNGTTSVTEPTGENVCTVRKVVDVYVDKLKRVPVDVKSKRFCFDVFRGFQCETVEHKIFIKYEKELEKREKQIKECCKGFYETDDKKCLPIYNCPAGFQGADCLISCDEGKYGAGCRFYCACLNGSTCNPVNGTCYCAPGFMGPRCETDNTIILP